MRQKIIKKLPVLKTVWLVGALREKKMATSQYDIQEMNTLSMNTNVATIANCNYTVDIIKNATASTHNNKI